MRQNPYHDPTHTQPQKVGLTLAAIQLFFTLTWTVYVIFLPQLAAQVGLAKESVLLILMMDQLIFLLADTTMGLAADKAVKVFGKLGRWVVLLTVASCPWLASLSFLGIGIAGAMAPYLTVHLRGLDPRWPFALSSLALLAATFGIAWAERTLKQGGAVVASAPAANDESLLRKPPSPPFLIAMALLGIGFQVHSSLNAAPQYLRFAKLADALRQPAD